MNKTKLMRLVTLTLFLFGLINDTNAQSRCEKFVKYIKQQDTGLNNELAFCKLLFANSSFRMDFIETYGKARWEALKKYKMTDEKELRVKNLDTNIKSVIRLRELLEINIPTKATGIAFVQVNNTYSFEIESGNWVFDTGKKEPTEFFMQEIQSYISKIKEAQQLIHNNKSPEDIMNFYHENVTFPLVIKSRVHGIYSYE